MTSQPSNPFENPELAMQYVAMDGSHYAKKYSIYPTVLGLLGNIRGQRILDLGCGDGEFARMLVDNGANHVLGVDGSREMIRIAKEKSEWHERNMGKKYASRSKYIHVPAEKFPHRTYCNQNDNAVAVLLFNYINKREQIAQVCRRVYNNLAPGGRFIAFQNHFIDIGFISGKRKVGNVTYEFKGESPERAGLYNLKRKDSQGNDIELELTDWEQADYKSALGIAGFRDVTWHNPIISQEGMDKLVKNFWINYIRAGLFRGFVARK